MKIFLVCSTADNWQKGGYGVSLLAAGHPKLLVSFVEFMKNPKQRFIVPEMPSPSEYKPNLVKPEEVTALPSLVAE